MEQGHRADEYIEVGQLRSCIVFLEKIADWSKTDNKVKKNYEKALNHDIMPTESHYVGLKKPVPVHVFYQTSWVDDYGFIHFRDDIYGRDV